MTSIAWKKKFLWQWVAANGIAELLGLGTVAIVGFLITKQMGEPHGLGQSLTYAVLFVMLGAFEGLVVGVAQAKVLLQRLPALQGWVGATIIGAVVAWTLGMAPSTLMSINEATANGPPQEMNETLVLLLAAGLGFLAGPILAFFQWRCLRRYVTRQAAWWLPANALAWMLGMPLIFIGAHMITPSSSPILIGLWVSLSLLTAGAVVGAVHGRVLIWLLS
jgi:hypothetical protein